MSTHTHKSHNVVTVAVAPISVWAYAQMYTTQADMKEAMIQQILSPITAEEAHSNILTMAWLSQFTPSQEPRYRIGIVQPSIHEWKLLELVRNTDLVARRAALLADERKYRKKCIELHKKVQLLFLTHREAVFRIAKEKDKIARKCGILQCTPVAKKVIGKGDCCAICMQSLAEGELTYCAGQCGTHFHVECVEGWEAFGRAQRAEGKKWFANCNYCRQPWVSGRVEEEREVGFFGRVARGRWDRLDGLARG